MLRSYSRSTLKANAPGVPNWSTWTEWSMTRSAWTSGLTRPGSPPRSAIASRMAARSTTAGTPVRSWRMTREGMNGISASAATPGRQAVRVSTSSGRTMPSPAWRSRFSSRIRIVTGADAEVHPIGQDRQPIVIGEAGAERRPGAEGIIRRQPRSSSLARYTRRVQAYRDRSRDAGARR